MGTRRGRGKIFRHTHLVRGGTLMLQPTNAPYLASRLDPFDTIPTSSEVGV